MTPQEWGREQAALAPPWSDETFRLVLATLGYAQQPASDTPCPIGTHSPLRPTPTTPPISTGTPRPTPTSRVETDRAVPYPTTQ